MAAKHLINRQITVSSLMVIDPAGTRYGPLSRIAAYDLATQHGLDLVLVSTEPPVAKLMDYGRFLFEEKKKRKERENSPEAKRKQNLTDIKEITLSYKIASHDRQTLIQRADSFLEKGHKVRFSIRLKGRERSHEDLAVALLHGIAEGLRATVDYAPRNDGQKVVMVLSP